MGHVEKRGPKRYVAVWKDQAGKRRGKTFERKIDATRHLAITSAAVLRREWIDPNDGKVTLGAYADQWRIHRDIRETTRDRYRRERQYLDPIADMPLASITASTIEEWQSALLRRLSRSTVATVRAGLAAILNTAVRDRLIPFNPVKSLPKLVPDAADEIVPFTVEQVNDIHAAITPWYRAAVLVGAQCGLRRGEAFALRADRVDFLRRTITVDAKIGNLIRVEGQLRFGPPKTPTSVRKVPLPSGVGEALGRHIERYGLGPDGVLFHTRGGQLVDASVLAEAWRRVAPAESRFHDLRHFYASVLVQGGASVVEVQARMGHASAVETLKTYSHLWPSSEDTTRRIIEAAFEPKVESEQQGRPASRRSTHRFRIHPSRRLSGRSRDATGEAQPSISLP